MEMLEAHPNTRTSPVRVLSGMGKTTPEIPGFPLGNRVSGITRFYLQENRYDK